jgi:hypothetical protein
MVLSGPNIKSQQSHVPASKKQMFSNMGSIQVVQDEDNYYRGDEISPQSQIENASRSDQSNYTGSKKGKRVGQNPSMER